MKWVWTVPSEMVCKKRADQVILDAYLQDKHEPILTRSTLTKWIKNQKVLVDDKPLKASQKLLPGQIVQIFFDPPPSIVPENIPVHIIYEDEDILVINKQPGLTVHPTPTQQGPTLIHALCFLGKKLSLSAGAYRPGIVHRLDKYTSGLLILAKTDLAYFQLIKDFALRKIKKTYLALCFGTPKVSTIQKPIGRSFSDRKKMAINFKVGKPAITHLKIKKTYLFDNIDISELEIQLETGRTHQIRVHLHSIGNSLIADPVYTHSLRTTRLKFLPKKIQDSIALLEGQALHAQKLEFLHPVQKKNMTFLANPFENLQQLLTTLHLSAGE